MAATNRNSESLSILMAAALGLPGMSALADDPNVRNDHILFSYNHGDYDEPSGQSYLNKNLLVKGIIKLEPQERMHVRTDQLSLTIPLYDRYEVKLNTIRDITSGASILTNIPINGIPRVVLSTASINDKREVVDVTGAYYGDENYVNLNVGKSIENDYISKFISTNYRHYFNDKTTTLNIGGEFDNDLTWGTYYPTNPYSYPSIYNSLHTRVLSVGVSQILDANSIAEFTLANRDSYGFLNEQYRAATISANNKNYFVLDNRPDSHSQWTALARYHHYFSKTNSALHLDYRYANDSWGADSHTLEGKWRFDLGSGWSVSPGLRYYTQKAADFYDVYFTSLPSGLMVFQPDKLLYVLPKNQAMSSDYRLAGFGVISPKFEVVKKFDNGFLVRGSVEFNYRKHSYELFDSRGSSIDDYKSRLLSVSVDYTF